MPDPVEAERNCGICNYLKQLQPERTLWEDEYWVCGPLLDVPGWTMVMTRRHVEGLWSLSDEEAVRFGLIMRDIAEVVKDVTGAQRVHFAAMGEVAPHYHNAILPRLADEEPVWDSMAMVERARITADLDAALPIEAMLRARLADINSYDKLAG